MPKKPKKAPIRDDQTPSSDAPYCECMGSVHGLYINCTCKISPHDQSLWKDPL
jgi:hypothetical protein